MENMCALFLELEGGAGRMPWRERPSSVMTRNEWGHFEVGGGPPAVFPDVTEGPTIEGSGMALVADIAVQEKTGSQSSTSPELDDEPVLTQTLTIYVSRYWDGHGRWNFNRPLKSLARRNQATREPREYHCLVKRPRTAKEIENMPVVNCFFINLSFESTGT